MADLGIIPDAGVLLRDGIICEVGGMRRLENLAAARGAVEIDATGKVVLPGFVDCHTHLMFPLAQAADAERGGAPDIERAARTLVGATAQRLAARGRNWLRMVARHGTTTVEAKTGCGLNVSAELKVLRVLKVLNRGALDIVPTFLCRPEMPPADNQVFRDLLATISRRHLARFADFAWDTEGMHRGQLLPLLQAARSLGFALKIHAEQHSCGAAVSLAAEYGATSIDHLEYSTLDQARTLAAVPTIATLLPCASFRHGHHAPARTLLEAGAALALGTNFNPVHTPSLNMQTAISLACTQMGLSPAEAITAATINAAGALRLEARIGSLEVQKQADIVILDTGDYRDLGYQLGTNLVHTVIKKGKILGPAEA